MWVGHLSLMKSLNTVAIGTWRDRTERRPYKCTGTLAIGGFSTVNGYFAKCGYTWIYTRSPNSVPILSTECMYMYASAYWPLLIWSYRMHIYIFVDARPTACISVGFAYPIDTSRCLYTFYPCRMHNSHAHRQKLSLIKAPFTMNLLYYSYYSRIMMI